MDIGCYPVHASRFAFGQQPTRVVGCIDRDPKTQIDRLTSAILEFPGGQSIFTCSTQLVPYQRMQFLGTRGRIEIEIPFNAPPDRPTRISSTTAETFPEAAFARRRFPPATNTRCRAMPSREPFWTRPTFPCRLKMRLRTWP